MIQRIKYTAAALVASLALLEGNAQTLRSSYFLDGSVHRHELNPAFMGERNYVSFPVLGGLNLGVQGNMGLSNFIYRLNDPASSYELTSFMSPTVSSSEFLGGLKDNNSIDLNLSMPVFSFGFHKWGGFNTFGVNLRVNSSVNLPYDLFAFMKNMQQDGTTHYNLKNLGVRANAYAEIAFGHSREIMENLTVGAKLKVLLGAGNVDAYVNNADITLADDRWSMSLDAQGDLSVKGMALKTDPADAQGRREVTGVEMDGFSPIAGTGFGIDLGAVYDMNEFVEGLTVSASLLDLGFISWKETHRIANDGSTPFVFDGFTDIVVNDGDADNSLDNQFDRLSDDLEGMVKFSDGGMASKRTTALNAVLNIGAEYELPWYRNLTFGFLMTSRFNKPYTWTEGRFYANVAPLGWLDLSVNYAASRFGSSMGCMLNFHPKGFNFFIGSDNIPFKVNPQFIPLHNMNANVCLGINFTFGKKHCFGGKQEQS